MARVLQSMLMEAFWWQALLWPLFTCKWWIYIHITILCIHTLFVEVQLINVLNFKASTLKCCGYIILLLSWSPDFLPLSFPYLKCLRNILKLYHYSLCTYIWFVCTQDLPPIMCTITKINNPPLPATQRIFLPLPSFLQTLSDFLPTTEL